MLQNKVWLAALSVVIAAALGAPAGAQ